MVAFFGFALLAAALLPSGILAHPGHNVKAEYAQRAAYMAKAERRSLAHCAEELKASGLQERAIARRQAHVERLRTKRSLEARDFRTALNTSHHSTHNYTSQTPADVLFAGNASCILSPEVTEGPYYVTGELIRQNVVEKEPGVALTYEVQVLDVNTCKPLPGIYLEMWSCNSTGIYGGIAGGNANGVNDDRELNNTMLRGIQKSTKDGVVLFDTIVPGHYMGRTPHIHVLAHINATVLPNSTVTGGTVSHVGQLFFDQSLYTAIKATKPYNTNMQPLTTNEQDFIMAQEAQNSDPVLEYTMLGNKVEDGLFGWIAFGVDPKANRTVNAAANWGKDGGKANPNGGFPPFPPGGFPGFPSGGFPGGFPTAFPSGFTGFPPLPSGFSFPPLPSGFSFPPFPMPSNAPAPTVTGPSVGGSTAPPRATGS